MILRFLRSLLNREEKASPIVPSKKSSTLIRLQHNCARVTVDQELRSARTLHHGNKPVHR